MKPIDVTHRADFKLLGDVVSINTLKPRIERFATIEAGLAEARALRSEITQLGKYTQAAGFDSGRNFHRVASIPPSVWSAVVQIFPDAGVDKKLYYALLAGPLKDYDLRGIPTLT